jgi:hypothetical protein
VIVHGELRLSPWVDAADLERRGAVFVWQQDAAATGLPEGLRAAFPRIELRPPLVLPRGTLYPRAPTVVGYAVLPPRP